MGSEFALDVAVAFFFLGGVACVRANENECFCDYDTAALVRSWVVSASTMSVVGKKKTHATVFFVSTSQPSFLSLFHSSLSVPLREKNTMMP